MSAESGVNFRGGYASSSSLPNPEDIQMEDCTLALIAANKALGEAQEDLNDQIIDTEPGSVTYDCLACFARLTDAGFSNIIGSMSCRALFRDGAIQAIESSKS